MGLENGGELGVIFDDSWKIEGATRISWFYVSQNSDLLEVCAFEQYEEAFRDYAKNQGLRVVETDRGPAVRLNSTDQSIGSAVYAQSL